MEDKEKQDPVDIDMDKVNEHIDMRIAELNEHIDMRIAAFKAEAIEQVLLRVDGFLQEVCKREKKINRFNLFATFVWLATAIYVLCTIVFGK